MSTFLPKNVQDDLDAARIAALKKTSRLRIVADGVEYKVLHRWSNGFAVDVADAPKLRGLVDLYDGGNHLLQCLIVASEEEAGQMRYEFKRATDVHDRAPLDFYLDPDAPIALIGKD